MKNLMMVVLLLTFFATANSQTVNDLPIKDIDVEYMQIVGTSKLFSSKLTIQIDFGQRTKVFSFGKETLVKDEDGKNLEFNSMVDALNFMSKNGFDFINAHTITMGNQNVYHFLLKNRKNKVKDEAAVQ